MYVCILRHSLFHLFILYLSLTCLYNTALLRTCYVVSPHRDFKKYEMKIRKANDLQFKM